jgi:hypothetical protein
MKIFPRSNLLTEQTRRRKKRLYRNAVGKTMTSLQKTKPNSLFSKRKQEKKPVAIKAFSVYIYIQ